MPIPKTILAIAAILMREFVPMAVTYPQSSCPNAWTLKTESANGLGNSPRTGHQT